MRIRLVVLKLTCFLALPFCLDAHAFEKGAKDLGCLNTLDRSYLTNYYQPHYWDWAKADSVDPTSFSYGIGRDWDRKIFPNDTDAIDFNRYFSIADDHLRIKGFVRDNEFYISDRADTGENIRQLINKPGRNVLVFYAHETAKNFCRALLGRCDSLVHFSWVRREGPGYGLSPGPFPYNYVAVANQSPGWQDIVLPWKEIPSGISDFKFYNCTKAQGNDEK